MKNFVQSGEVLSLTAPYDVASGGGFQIGSLFAVAAQAALSGAAVEGRPRGVQDLAKTTGQAWTVGQKLYWDNTNKLVTSTVGSNLLIGVAAAAAISAATVGRVFVMGLTA